MVACDAHVLDGCALPAVTAGELAERRYRAVLRPATRTRLPTRHGEFEAVAYSEPRTGATVLALVGGAARDRDRVPVRLHHACVVGDTFGSAACDCARELQQELRALAAGDCGVLLYLPAEDGQRTELVHSAGMTAQQDDAGTGWLAVGMEAILDDLGVVRANGPP
jgi:3,4-dihydroxy 2-butanone 4-phosphate synthase/GTP cyclohydrolase II